MDALEKLKRTLLTVNKTALARLRPGDMLQMQAELSRLKEQVKATLQLDAVALDSIEDALRSYRLNKYLKGLRQIRLVCYGCTQGGVTERVIENRELFDKLLQYVEQYRDRRRTFRKLYRALLGSYFVYDPVSSNTGGLGQREILRAFLAKHLADFEIGEFTPDWLAALSKYPALLGDRPGQVIEVSFLQGDWSIFNEICERLELDSGAWLVRQLVMAQFMAVKGMDDAMFREHLDSLLLFLNDYPLYAGAGLKALLDRYARCKDRHVHEALRDFAVELWGNPWLAPHQWQCSIQARAMLAHWLKHQLLAEFFSILSNDDPGHARRFNFWDLYCEDMTGMYFALGSNAYARGNMALYKFRRHAKGLIAKLTEEKHGVHTCIMQFKHAHVVEFNRENNVAYFYDTKQGTPSFYFAKGWVDIGAISVKDIEPGADIARHSNPLRHQDSLNLTWEGRFAQEMGMSDNAVAAFCGKYQCRYEDLRDQDGSQWIWPEAADQYGAEVWSVLISGLGPYPPEKNGYYRLTYPGLN